MARAGAGMARAGAQLLFEGTVCDVACIEESDAAPEVVAAKIAAALHVELRLKTEEASRLEKGVSLLQQELRQAEAAFSVASTAATALGEKAERLLLLLSYAQVP